MGPRVDRRHLAADAGSRAVEQFAAAACLLAGGTLTFAFIGKDAARVDYEDYH